MTSLEVVCTGHYIRRFLRRSLVLKIKLNTRQTLSTTDKIERRKNMANSEGPNSDCSIDILFKSEKAHHGGQTWHIFCLSQMRSKLHYLIIPSFKKVVHICVEAVKMMESTGGSLINPPTVPVQWG